MRVPVDCRCRIGRDPARETLGFIRVGAHACCPSTKTGNANCAEPVRDGLCLANDFGKSEAAHVRRGPMPSSRGETESPRALKLGRLGPTVSSRRARPASWSPVIAEARARRPSEELPQLALPLSWRSAFASCMRPVSKSGLSNSEVPKYSPDSPGRDHSHRLAAL